MLAAIQRGADMFDCVIPTRVARHGKVLTGVGDFNITRAEFETDDRPLEEGCGCHTCHRHTRAYLRHLVKMGELGAHRLMTIHNLHYTLKLINGAREAIIAGVLDAYVEGVRSKRDESP